MTDDPVPLRLAHVERVDAGGRLGEATHQHSATGQRVRQHHPIDATVQYEQGRFPGRISTQTIDRGVDPVH